MDNYDFSHFLNQIRDLDLPEMISVADKRCTFLEKVSVGSKAANERREAGSLDLSRKIKSVLFWLYNGVKPAGLSEDEFKMLQPLCMSLVEKGQLKKDALEAFK